MTDDTAKADAWRIADAKRWLVYLDGAGLMHMIEAVADENGVCTPAAKASVCGQVPLAQLAPFNGQGYGEQGLREAACMFGRQFCGKCVAGLYGE